MNAPRKLTIQQVRRITGASWLALAEQYAANAQTLHEIATKARITGKKFRGYTAEHAQAAADDMAERSAACLAQSS